jgi:hypothetical protein
MSLASASELQGVWENKAERICRGALDQVEKLTEDSGMGHQQEGQLDPLKATMSRITELAQLVEKFILEPSKAKLREISSKSKAQNMARPLMRLENPITSIKAHEMMNG